ncbi:MAG: hypothetical protein H6774_01680 [Pseudomonadales bacterium]|nr:hypothetical protein [Candidatus Woesebacteria bacterium]MCB9801778.1 hypothetical protein [Pseudomonadales bacterium]
MRSDNDKPTLKKLRVSRYMLMVMALLLVSVIVWTFAMIATSANADSFVSADLETLARPLSPSIDINTVTSLQEKLFFSTSELSSFAIYRVIINETTGQEVITTLGEPTSSSSASPTPSPTF